MADPPFVKVGVSLRQRLPELSDTELRVLLALGLRINEERQCWPAIYVLVDECARSERSIRYALNKLIKLGFINIGRRAGGRSKTSVYTLNGYFAYGSEAVQLIAPFPETLQSFAPFPHKKGAISDKKGAISDKKGAISDKKRGQSPQAEQIPKKNHRRRTIEEEPLKKKNMVGTVMLLLEEERGYRSPAEAKERAAAKQMLDRGHSPDAIIACRRELKQRPFWRDKELTLNSVAGQIDNWSRMRGEKGKPSDPKERGTHGRVTGSRPPSDYRGRW